MTRRATVLETVALVLLLVMPDQLPAATDDLVIQSGGGSPYPEVAVDVAADASVAASADAFGVTLWHLSSRSRIDYLPLEEGVEQVRVLRDGLGLWVTSPESFSVVTTVDGETALRAPRAQQGSTEGVFDAITDLRFRVIAVSDSNGVLLVRRDDEGRFSERIPVPDAAMARLAISDDGSLLATHNGELRVWDTDTMTLRMEVTDAGTAPLNPGAMRFSPGGDQLLVEGGQGRVLGAAPVDVYRLDEGHVGRVERAASAVFLEDGRLAYLDAQGCLYTWTADAGASRRPTPCRDDASPRIAPVGDGLLFGGRRLWSLDSQGEIAVLGGDGPTERLVDVDEARGVLRTIEAGQFDDDGARVTAPGSRALYQWDLATGRRSRVTDPAQWREVQSGDPQILACGPADPWEDWRLVETTADGRLLVADATGVTLCDGEEELARLDRPTGTGDVALPSLIRLREDQDGQAILFLADRAGYLEIWDWSGGERLSREPIATDYAGAAGGMLPLLHDIGFSRSGSLWAVSPGGLTLGGAEGSHRLDTGFTFAAAHDPERDRIFLSTVDGLRVFDVDAGEEVAQVSIGPYPMTEHLISDRRLYARTADGSIQVIDLETLEPLVSLHAVGDAGSIVLAPDGAYAATRDAVVAMAERDGIDLRHYGAFDLERNRPDRVLARLGHADDETLAGLSRLVSLRRQRQGARASDAEVPLDWQHRPPLYTQASSLPLALRASSAAELHLFINNVPVTPAGGVAVDAGVTEQTVNLLPGDNRITAHLRTDDGYSEQLVAVVYLDQPPAEVDTWFVGVGVSDYGESAFDLRYAAKDVRDMEAELRRRSEGDFHSLLLLDGDATRDAVLAAGRFLEQAAEHDRVVLYFAGHGLLGEEGRYYFAPTDMRFTDPARRGIEFSGIENLLRQTAARERLIFIDSCHAGEGGGGGLVPAGETQTRTSAMGTVSSRGVRRVDAHEASSPVVDRPLLEDVFIDLREASGAHVIAAAGAEELALESPRWGNGVFTASVLHGLQSGAADLDGDRRIRVDELRRFVADRVTELTEGRQVPTARQANHQQDFDLAEAVDPELGVAPGFEVPAMTHAAEHVAYSTDGRYLVTSGDGRLTRFDLGDGNAGEPMAIGNGDVVDMVVGPRGRHALVLIRPEDFQQEDRLKLVAIEERQVHDLGTEDEAGYLGGFPLSAAFSQDGDWVAVEAYFTESGLRAWRTDQPTVRRHVRAPFHGMVDAVTAVEGARFRVVDEQGWLFDVDLDAGTASEGWQLPLPDDAGGTLDRTAAAGADVYGHNHAGFGDRGRLLTRVWWSSAEDREYLGIWDLQTRRLLLNRPADNLVDVRVSPGAPTLAVLEGQAQSLQDIFSPFAGNPDTGTFRVLDLHRGGEVAWLYAGRFWQHTPWALRPDGGSLVQVPTNYAARYFTGWSVGTPETH